MNSTPSQAHQNIHPNLKLFIAITKNKQQPINASISEYQMLFINELQTSIINANKHLASSLFI